MLAQLKQEDVFRSISDNVGNSRSDPRVFYAFIMGVAVLILLLVLINAWRKRGSSTRAVNRQGKLTKEILRQLPLKKGEYKHLKTMAEEQGCESPLTLILCPSLMAKGMTEKGKADKKVLMNVARKMGVVKKK
jgi:hypothetical protein